jgi:hypothetical protein
MLFAAASLALAASSLSAQMTADPDKAAKQTSPSPAGWSVRLDRPTAKRDDIAFTTMGKGMHVTSGPAAIYWPAGAGPSGAFTVAATFTQMKAPQHAEAYGLFVGGRDLDQPGQQYLYFLVRGDGKYMVKHRAGADVHTITDWTESPAVTKQDANGKATHALQVVVTESTVTFRANGKDVAAMPRSALKAFSTDGIAGMRVNHNLDVHIADFAVTK